MVKRPVEVSRNANYRADLAAKSRGTSPTIVVHYKLRVR